MAFSLLATGRFADAYGVGSGPTAHCAPLHPFLLALLFRIFGTGAGGYRAIAVLGSVASSTAFALLPALAEAGGLGLATGIAAGLAGALLPFNFWPQTTGTFEAPLAAAALTGLCILLCRIWKRARFSVAEGATFGVAGGLALLLSPGLLPILATWLVALCIRFRKQLRRVFPCAGVAAGCALAVMLPWAVRNYMVMGSPILTRSNFGLELQMSNNDLATADDEVNVRTLWFLHSHPSTDAGERAKLRMLGEAAYHHARELQAFAWIRSHRERFIQLTAERLWLFWFPNMSRRWQSAAEAILTFLSLVGVVLLFRKGHEFAWIASAVLVSFPAVYYLIESTARYRFPIEPLLFLLMIIPFRRPFYRGGR